VLGVANAYVGMTHSPQAPLNPEQALHRILQAAGSRFDPDVVEEGLRVAVNGQSSR
jgi:HD-GYP domain-containing protein (c-di-GMP phosphodiesterase class II)